MSRSDASPARCAAVWSAATLVAALLVGWCLPDVVDAVASPPAAADVAGWLVLTCEAVALPVLGWLWLLVTLLTLDAARRSGPRRGVPRWLGRLVLAACGVGLVGGLAGPTYAAPGPDSPLAGLPLPDRPAGHARLHRLAEPDGPRPDRVAGPAATPRPVTVRVAPGDSLWDLAAAELPADASNAAVDQRWRAVHAANRDVIGADPDLILPGQRLRLPPDRPAT